jgi:hypothetical protein
LNRPQIEAGSKNAGTIYMEGARLQGFLQTPNLRLQNESKMKAKFGLSTQSGKRR